MPRYEEDDIDALGWFLKILFRLLVAICLIMLITWMEWS